MKDKDLEKAERDIQEAVQRMQDKNKASLEKEEQSLLAKIFKIKSIKKNEEDEKKKKNIVPIALFGDRKSVV